MDATYAEKIKQLHKTLAIPADYAAQRKLTLQYEPAELIAIENDIFARQQQLTPEAALHWNKMREAAKQENILSPQKLASALHNQATLSKRYNDMFNFISFLKNDPIFSYHELNKLIIEN